MAFYFLYLLGVAKELFLYMYQIESLCAPTQLQIGQHMQHVLINCIIQFAMVSSLRPQFVILVTKLYKYIPVFFEHFMWLAVRYSELQHVPDHWWDHSAVNSIQY